VDSSVPTNATRRQHRVVVSAGVVAVSLTPLAGWWLIGDQSFTGRPRDDLDYAFRAPEIAGWITAAAGAIALVIATAAVVTLVFAARRGLIDDRWLGVIGMLIGAGVLLAFIARTRRAPACRVSRTAP
jgi:hypothetical protein